MSIPGRITFSHVYNLIRGAIVNKNTPTPLGRWKLQNNRSNQIALNILYANEDHCGTCTKYTICENENDDRLLLDEFICMNMSTPNNNNNTASNNNNTSSNDKPKSSTM